MKAIIPLIIKTCLILMIVYLFVFCFYRLRDDRIGVVKKISTGEVVLIFNDRFNFIWQGALPWEYNLEIIGTGTTVLINANVTIPSLSQLSEDIYSVRIPFSVSYRIDRLNPPDKAYFTDRAAIDAYVKSFINSICSTVLIGYLDPEYNRSAILKAEPELNSMMISAIKEKLKNAGVICDRLEIISRGYFPNEDLYKEGLSRCKELRDLDFSNIKQQISVKNSLLKDRSQYELYYERLSRISSLIKDNPDILKYIYIDKMGDDIKVIISSDKTGIPVMFGNPSDEKKSDTKGDIDNFR
jgi:hypothetical protein